MIASFCCPFKLPSWPIPFAFPCPFKGYITSSWPHSRRLLWEIGLEFLGPWEKMMLEWAKELIPEALGATVAAACLLKQCPKQHHCYQPSPWDWLQVGLWRRGSFFSAQKETALSGHWQGTSLAGSLLTPKPLSFSRKLLLCTTICSFCSLALETALLNITVVSSRWLAKKKT